MVRLLLEDVTLLKADHLVAQVRFKGGATQTLVLPLPLSAWQLRKTDPAVVETIDHLLDQHTEGEIAAILNQRGLPPGVGSVFHVRMVARLRTDYRLASRFVRLRARGMLTLKEMATLLQIDPTTVKTWHARGILRGAAFNDKGECLYDHPGPISLSTQPGRKLSLRYPGASSPGLSQQGAV